MANPLASNVFVDDVWYGPSYPENAVTDEVLAKITNPAAFDVEAQGHHPDLRFRVDDFAASSRPPLVFDSDSGYDDDASVREVLEWVGDDQAKASQAMTRENDRAAGPRSSLVSALERIVGG